MQNTITKEQIDNSIEKVTLEHMKSLKQDYLDSIKSLPDDFINNPVTREEVVLHKSFSNSIVILREVLYDLFLSD